MAWVVENSRRAHCRGSFNLESQQSRSDHPQTLISREALGISLEKLGFDICIASSSDEDFEENVSIGEGTKRVRITKSSKTYTTGAPIFSNSEREYLTVVTLAQIMRQNRYDARLAFAFLVHTVLIGEARLSDRPYFASNKDIRGEDEISDFITEFSHISRAILEQEIWSSAMDRKFVPCDVADLIDGRLFIAILGGAIDFMKLKAKIDQLCRVLNIAYGTPLENLENAIPARTTGMKPAPAYVDVSSQVSILPFSNPAFDKHLVSIKISTNSSMKFNPESARIFQEISHWHNSKRRLDPKSIHPLSEKDKSRALRREQFFMAEMQAYAASLTNAAGKILEPEIVTVSEGKKGSKSHQEIKDSEDSENSKKPKNTKAASNRKGAGKKLILEGIAAKKATKDSENAEKLFSSWQTVRKGINLESTLSAKYMKAKAYLRDLTSSKRAILEAEVQFYLLTVLLDIYRTLYRQRLDVLDKDPQDVKITTPNDAEYYGVAALIWDTIRRLSATSGVTKSIAEQSKQVLKSLGLPRIDFPKPELDRTLAFRPNLSLLSAKDLSVNLDPIDFQCLYCGPYMDRNLDSKADPRVPFKPDGWQRRVLDELDADRSVFVVAPTSAGKTFISFYAMERILKADNDGVLVYVAPTKALVNQIAAEIQARYKKTYKYPGKSVWAIHTRDYRVNNPTGCQILVTVPHILQIMLLSPSNARGWSTQVRTIIFDEIHSIGNAEDGVVWEQLLLLAPCPIIALSATVGNPEQFSSWLASTQESAGYQLTMIKHPHRYSDLRKFIFHPPERFAFSGLSKKSSFATLGLDGVENLSFIHPIASLVNKSRGIPDDLSLEARDCLSLWQAMVKYQTQEFPVDPSLCPPGADVVRKADVIEWEAKLKNLLKIWIRDDASPFDKVVEYLSKSMNNDSHPRHQISSYSASDSSASETVKVDGENLLDTTLPLVCRLHERDSLPAIFFNYERSKCEQICQALLEQVKAAEAQWKAKSPAWKKKLSDWEHWKLEQAKLAGKRAPKVASKSKTKEDEDPFTKADRAQDAANNDASPFTSFDPEAPLDGFHFAVKHKVESSELSRYFWQMKKRGLPNWLMEGLTRGIGVHHAGMNRKYRQV